MKSVRKENEWLWRKGFVKEMSFKSGVKGRGSDRWWERRWWLWWGYVGWGEPGGEWTQWGWRNEEWSWFQRWADAYLKERLVICNEEDTSVVTLARPSASSSLQITNRSFTYASPYLWNQLPSSFRQPHSVHCPPGSPHPAHITSQQSPPSLSPSITPSTFHSRLKTHLFHKSFPP